MKNKIWKNIVVLSIITMLSGCSSENVSKINSDEIIITNADETTAVTSQPETSTEPLKLHPINEENITILDVNSYNKEDIVQRTDNLLLFKPMISISEAFPNMTYEKINFPDKFSPNLYNNGKFYDAYCIPPTSPQTATDRDNYEINCFDLKTNELSTLFKVNDKSASITNCEGNYLLWQESPNNYWLQPSYHLYNLETGEDIKYYDAVLDEDNCSYYGLHWNSPVIIDDKIYYDDMVGVYEDGVAHYIIYCYDIKNKKLETVYDDAQNPFKYQGKLAWYNLSSNRENAVFCNEENTFLRFEYTFHADLTTAGDLMIMHDRLSHAYLTSFDDTLECLELELGTDDTEHFWVSDGIKLIKDNKAEPILIGTISDAVGHIIDPVSDGRFICWRGSDNAGKPTFYDSEKNYVIEINFLPYKTNPSYYYKFCDDKLLLICYGHDENDESYTDYYMISLNENQ